MTAAAQVAPPWRFAPEFAVVWKGLGAAAAAAAAQQQLRQEQEEDAAYDAFHAQEKDDDTGRFLRAIGADDEPEEEEKEHEGDDDDTGRFLRVASSDDEQDDELDENVAYIDQDTAVPADLFERLIDLAAASRTGTHRRCSSGHRLVLSRGH